MATSIKYKPNFNLSVDEYNAVLEMARRRVLELHHDEVLDWFKKLRDAIELQGKEVNDAQV